jgi:hypothetical protein
MLNLDFSLIFYLLIMVKTFHKIQIWKYSNTTDPLYNKKALCTEEKCFL